MFFHESKLNPIPNNWTEHLGIIIDKVYQDAANNDVEIVDILLLVSPDTLLSVLKESGKEHDVRAELRSHNYPHKDEVYGIQASNALRDDSVILMIMEREDKLS